MPKISWIVTLLGKDGNEYTETVKAFTEDGAINRAEERVHDRTGQRHAKDVVTVKKLDTADAF